jgi:hypothetical protein
MTSWDTPLRLSPSNEGNSVLAILQQSTSSASSSSDLAAAWIALGVVAFLMLLTLIGYWKVFTKLGLHGWLGLIPFVNVYMIFKARGQRDPLLWLILCLIPCLNIIGTWFLASDTAEMFDKRIGWKIFLFLVPGLSHVILGLGSSTADPRFIAPGVGLNKAV